MIQDHRRDVLSVCGRKRLPTRHCVDFDHVHSSVASGQQVDAGDAGSYGLGRAASELDPLRARFDGLGDFFDPLSLVGGMTNDPKDRHVLAAAVRANAEVVVTFNLADFPDPALKTFDIIAIHPTLRIVLIIEIKSGLESGATVVIGPYRAVSRTLQPGMNVVQQGAGPSAGASAGATAGAEAEERSEERPLPWPEPAVWRART